MNEVELEREIETAISVLAEINELPCAVCGEEGDTLPCIECDKLLCSDCAEGTTWCKEHFPN